MNTLNWVKARTGVYVVEEGSNSSGRWRRWSDGFLEQWVTKKVTSMVLDWSGFVTFPQAFTTTTYQAVAQPARAARTVSTSTPPVIEERKNGN